MLSLQFLKKLRPRTRGQETNVVIPNKSAFLLCGIVPAMIRIRMPTAQGLSFCVSLRKRAPLIDLHISDFSLL